MNNYINEIAPFEERLKQPLSYRFQWMIDQLEKDTRKPKEINVLDAGCGRGFFVHKLIELKYNVRGFDNFSETGENKAREYYDSAKAYCFHADMNNISELKDESCDYITCSEVIEHLIEPEVAIKEFIRLLKPGGQIFITTPIGKALFDLDHKQFFYYKNLHKILKETLGEDNNFVILKGNKFFENAELNIWKIKIKKGLSGAQVYEEPNYLHECIMREVKKGDKVNIVGIHSKIMYLDLRDKGCDIKFEFTEPGWADITISTQPMNTQQDIKKTIDHIRISTNKKAMFFFNIGEDLLDKNPISDRIDFYTVADYIDYMQPKSSKIIRINRLVPNRTYDIFLVKLEGYQDGTNTE